MAAKQHRRGEGRAPCLFHPFLHIHEKNSPAGRQGRGGEGLGQAGGDHGWVSGGERGWRFGGERGRGTTFTACEAEGHRPCACIPSFFVFPLSLSSFLSPTPNHHPPNHDCRRLQGCLQLRPDRGRGRGRHQGGGRGGGGRGEGGTRTHTRSRFFQPRLSLSRAHALSLQHPSQLAKREGAPLTLHAITAAAKQVVAGLNWRLVMEVVDAAAGGGVAPRTVTATVWAPLGGAPLQVTALE